MVIILFLLFIFYDKAQSKRDYIRNSLFLEMKNYSLGAEDERFRTVDVKKDDDKKFYKLYEDAQSLHIFIPVSSIEKEEMIMIMGPSGPIIVPYSSKDKEVKKVWYPISDYTYQIKQMHSGLVWIFMLFVLGAVAISLLAAWYTLYPLRSSLRLLEDFIKDIIHDLNTPLSAILINLKMIDSKVEEQNEEITSIRTATQTIEMLHHNLDAYLREKKQIEETFSLDDVVGRYVTFFNPSYDYLAWDVDVGECTVTTDKQAFERIIYNLLSNACKYNTSKGKIKISLKGTLLSIRNSSYGVRNPERVFERFYKESERGLGIGLHIVDKLCQTLGIEKKLVLEGSDVIFTLNVKNITTLTENPDTIF